MYWQNTHAKDVSLDNIRTHTEEKPNIDRTLLLLSVLRRACSLQREQTGHTARLCSPLSG